MTQATKSPLYEAAILLRTILKQDPGLRPTYRNISRFLDTGGNFSIGLEGHVDPDATSGH